MSFIVPAYNEARTIREVLDRIHALELDKQIVLVDHGSTDATAEIVDEWLQGRDGGVLLLKANGGKGSAIRSAVPAFDGDQPAG